MIDIYGKDWGKTLVVFNGSEYDEGVEVLMMLFPEDYDIDYFAGKWYKRYAEEEGVIFYLDVVGYDRGEALEKSCEVDKYEVISLCDLKKSIFENSFIGKIQKELDL